MLEDYVMQQVRDGTYDLDGNMALLKLYQFYPNSVRYEVSIHPINWKQLIHYLDNPPCLAQRNDASPTAGFCYVQVVTFFSY